LGCILIFGVVAEVGGRVSLVFSSVGLEVSFFSGVSLLVLKAALLSSTAGVSSNFAKV